MTIIPLIIIAAILVVTVLLVISGGDEDAPSRQEQGPRASALAEGDCFTEFRQAGTTIFARSAPCTNPHQGEVVGKPALPILDYPGDGRLATEGEKACRVQASSLLAAGQSNEFTLLVGRPDREAWERGERTVTCLLRYTGGPKNFRLEGQWTPLSLLAAGDCIETWKDTSQMKVVDCTRKHDAQVLARLTLNGEKSPNEAKVYALCVAVAKDGHLTRSLIPK